MFELEFFFKKKSQLLSNFSFPLNKIIVAYITILEYALLQVAIMIQAGDMVNEISLDNR